MILTARRLRLGLLALAATFTAHLLPDQALAADAVVADSAPVRVSSPPASARMRWAGIGLRVGQTRYTLDGSPLREYIDHQGRKRGSDLAGQIAAQHLHDLHESAFTLSPSLHLGGSGYFFKAELPVGFAASFTSVGLGLYPLNYGFFIQRLGLFPYMSAGVSGHAARGTGAQGGKWTGAFGQARGAVGVKWRATGKLSLSLELGAAKAAGLLSAPASEGSSVGGLAGVRPTMDARGGLGHSLDVSFGIDLL